MKPHSDEDWAVVMRRPVLAMIYGAVLLALLTSLPDTTDLGRITCLSRVTHCGWSYRGWAVKRGDVWIVVDEDDPDHLLSDSERTTFWDKGVLVDGWGVYLKRGFAAPTREVMVHHLKFPRQVSVVLTADDEAAIRAGFLKVLLESHDYLPDEAELLASPSGVKVMRSLPFGYVVDGAIAALAIALCVIGKRSVADFRKAWWMGSADARLARGECPGCGYDIAGLRGGVCPECGTSIARSA